MTTTQLKTAARSFRAHKGYVVVSLAGLALALGMALLVAQYFRHELAYDRHHPTADRLVQVTAWLDGDDRPTAPLPALVGPTLAEEVPELEAVTRLYRPSPEPLLQTDRPGAGGARVARYDAGVLFADPAATELFGLAALEGRADLARPGTAVLTEAAAADYFGDGPAVGRTLVYERATPLEVVGVVPTPPTTTSVPYRVLASFATYEAMRAADGTPVEANGWDMYSFYTYALLRPGATAGRVAGRAREAVALRAGPSVISSAALAVGPLRSVHLGSDAERPLSPPGSPLYLGLLAGLVALLVAVASVNYANLAVARSLHRTTEVGVRATLGATPRGIAGQFLAESVVFVALAVPLALAVARLALPAFERVVGMELPLAYLGAPGLWAGAAAFVVGLGALAGAYPALVLARLRPTDALRGTARLSDGRFQKGLVGFQFAVSVFMAVCTVVLVAQVRHLDALDLGVDEERVFIVPTRTGAVSEQSAAFVEAVERLPGVAAASAASGAPTAFGGADGSVRPLGRDGAPVDMQIVGVDAGYLDALGIGLAAGRPLRGTAADSGRVALVNRAAAAALGWDDAVGKDLEYWGGRARTVVGVVEDFRYESPKLPVGPAVLVPLSDLWTSHVVVRTAPGEAARALAEVEAAWGAFSADRPFEFAFVDDAFDALTATESRTADAFALLAGLTLLIACLGLVGLVAFAAERRTREIGVRKTLGATDLDVVRLLGAEFGRHLAVGAAAALPLAYVASSRWLGGFADRVALSPLYFVGALAVAGAAAAATIAVRGLLAARAVPLDALRAD